MFSDPQTIPIGASCLPFIWIYLVKDDGTRKARAPCNGSPKIQGTVTLGKNMRGKPRSDGGKTILGYISSGRKYSCRSRRIKRIRRSTCTCTSGAIIHKIRQSMSLMVEIKRKRTYSRWSRVRLLKSIQGHP